MREIRFRLDGGDRNVGVAYVPETLSASAPVAVYCHGYGATKDVNPFTEELLRRGEEEGLAVVLFDLFGGGETGGSMGAMTYGRWAANTGDVVAWVAVQDWADADRIGAIGVSSGSPAALRCALDHAELAFVVSIATCISVHVGMPDSSPARVLAADLETLVAGGRATYFGNEVDLAFFRDYIGGAPVYRLPDLTCPVLFLQGADDNLWRRNDARLGYEGMLAAGLPARYVEIEGGDHGLDAGREVAVDALVAWLRELGVV